MKAVICEGFGPVDELKIGEVPDPTSRRGHVVIDVEAAGLNFPDVLCVQGLYQFRPEPPFIPGQEGAGVVTAVGEGVKDVQVGDRVAFVAPSEAFAEKVVVDAGMVWPIPEDMPFDTAAGFTMVYGTSYHALRQRAALVAGETLLVLGAAGGVGLAAVELGRAIGARVIAAASTAEKLKVAREAGADATINYAEEDLKARARELTGGMGVDVVYDPVGGPFTEPALRSVAWEGRYLVVGFAAGEIPKIPLNLVLLKGCQVAGVFWGAFTGRAPEQHRANMQQLKVLYEKGTIRPRIGARYPLSEVRRGLTDLAERKAVGKIVLTM